MHDVAVCMSMYLHVPDIGTFEHQAKYKSPKFNLGMSPKKICLPLICRNIWTLIYIISLKFHAKQDLKNNYNKSLLYPPWEQVHGALATIVNHGFIVVLKDDFFLLALWCSSIPGWSPIYGCCHKGGTAQHLSLPFLHCHWSCIWNVDT